jgi:hypothetical protein
MGAGSAGLLWYACCCSFVSFAGIVAVSLTVFGRMKDERARDAKAKALAAAAVSGEPSAPAVPSASPPSDPVA